jgi:hypothetical protein
MAQQVLTQFQENTDTWQKVPEILQSGSSLQTKVSPPSSSAITPTHSTVCPPTRHTPR